MPLGKKFYLYFLICTSFSLGQITAQKTGSNRHTPPLSQKESTKQGGSLSGRDEDFKAKYDSLYALFLKLQVENKRLELALAKGNSDAEKENIKAENAIKSLTEEPVRPVPAKSRKAFKHCLEATSYQPLFSEKITVVYNLDASGFRFSGQLQYQYAPEFGQREFRNQECKGSYSKEGSDIILHIINIDGVETDIHIRASDRSYKSYFKPGPKATVKPFTKVVDYTTMQVDKCL